MVRLLLFFWVTVFQSHGLIACGTVLGDVMVVVVVVF